MEQAKLRATKTLGEAAPDVDDLAAWVGKSRALEESRRAEERAKADKAARMLAQQARGLPRPGSGGRVKVGVKECRSVAGGDSESRQAGRARRQSARRLARQAGRYSSQLPARTTEERAPCLCARCCRRPRPLLRLHPQLQARPAAGAHKPADGGPRGHAPPLRGVRRRDARPITRRAAQDEEAGASEDDEADEHAGGAALGAAELAGMRVRHSAEELGAGETLVMTLADRPVLDARGELADDADELENPLAVRPAALPSPYPTLSPPPGLASPGRRRSPRAASAALRQALPYVAQRHPLLLYERSYPCEII